MKALVLFFSILFFAVSCQKETLKENELTGTKWEIWQYKESTTANPIPLNDTLVFLSDGNYTYNNHEQFYLLNDSGNFKKISLYGTKFGDISGNVSRDFNTYGEIIAKEFFEINSTSNQASYVLWMRRVD